MAIGRPATCTATVTDAVAGVTSTPTGKVAFVSSGSGSFSGNPCTLSQTRPGAASCSVTYTPSAIGSGSHTITASYSGDSTHKPSSGSFVQPVGPRGTSTSVSCSPNPVAVGQTTTCTATVTDEFRSGAFTPTGTVVFDSPSGGLPRTPCTLSGTGGSARCSVNYTPTALPGSYEIRAGYGGDSTHGVSGNSTMLTVTKRLTSTKVSCSPTQVAVGQPSTCTATVTDTNVGTKTTPSGTVSLTSTGPGGFSPNPCTLSPTSPGVAVCLVSYTPSGAGSDTITASYSGDSTHAVSSATTTLSVPVHPTSMSVSCLPTHVAVGQPSTCTATVTDAFSGPVTTPTGTVGMFPGGPGSFNGTSPCTLSEGTVGVASCSATFTPSGVEPGGDTTILASYGGDSGHLSSSNRTTVTVNSGIGAPPPPPSTGPTSKKQCKHGGWKNFGGRFKNQGACLRFVARQQHKHHRGSG